MQQNPKSFKRFPQVPRAPLPELAAFLAPLRVHFTQGPSAETLRQYLTGLLSEHTNKNCDTLAKIIPDTNEQQLQPLLPNMVWDETNLNRQRSILSLWAIVASLTSEVSRLFRPALHVSVASVKRANCDLLKTRV